VQARYSLPLITDHSFHKDRTRPALCPLQNKRTRQRRKN